MAKSNIFNPVDNKVDFIQVEHEMLEKWNKDDTLSTRNLEHFEI